MSKSFYPSDEYGSEELERASAKRRLRQWLSKRRRLDDDDDDPPTSPVTGSMPRPVPPLTDAALQAA